MFGNKSNLNLYLNSILSDTNKLTNIYNEIIKKDLSYKKYDINYKLRNYKKLIYNFQIKFRNRESIGTIKVLNKKEKKNRLLKFIDIIKSLKKYKNIDIIIDNKKNFNKSVDFYFKDNYIKKKKEKLVFFKLNSKICYSLNIYDKEKIFHDIIYYFYKIYLNSLNNIVNNNYLRRRSLNRINNIKGIKLHSLDFHEYLYNLIVKLQIKDKKNPNFNKIYIPRFLKNIRFKKNKKLKTKITNTMIDMTKNKIKKLVLRVNKIYKNSVCDLNLNQEIIIYNLLVNYLKNYYNIEENNFENKNYEEVKNTIIGTKLIDEYKKNGENSNDLSVKRNTIKRSAKIDILYQQAKINKSKKFGKILKFQKNYKKITFANNLIKKPTKMSKFNSIRHRTSNSNTEKYFSVFSISNSRNILKNNKENLLKSNFQVYSKNKKIDLKNVILREFLKKSVKIRFKKNSNRLNKLYNVG